MKKHYKKVRPLYRARKEDDFRYDLTSGGYFRPIRTFCELRQREADIADFRDLRMAPPHRPRRSHGLLDAWNDVRISRNWGRSWKDYTRFRKQWDR